MSASAQPDLKKIADLIRAGKGEKARAQLVELLRSQPQNAQAWYLLSFVVDDPQRKQYALMQALKAQPDFVRARDRLRTLRGDAPPPPKPQPAPEAPPPITPAFAPSADLEQDLRPEPAEPQRSGGRSPLRPVLIGLVLVALLALAWFFGGDLLAGGQGAAPTATNPPFRTLPAVWTPTGGVQPEQTVTPEPGPVATLQPEAQALLDTIGAQASQLRGLSSARVVQAVLVQDGAARSQLSTFIPSNTAETQQAERALRALGLLSANGSLQDYAINKQLDAYGAAYNAAQRRVYFVGSQLSDALAYSYARTFGRVLLADAHSDLFTTSQRCTVFDDACRATQALLQGDANLAGEEWLSAHGAAAFDPASLPTPNYARIQSGAPSDFAVLDARFAAETGLAFVRGLFTEGGWEQVNAAYTNPPSTTEQILHADKYAANEAALNVQPVDLATALGAGWERQANGSLGEWLTRLVLAAGADPAARIPEESAITAAAGWGGDSLQVYWRESDDQLAMVQHWLADDAANGQELHAGMQQYLSLRFGGAPGELGRGRCWQAGGQAACLLLNGAEVVWLLLPDDPELISAVLALFPQIP